MTTVTEVIKNALALPLADRSYVTAKLIESLEQEQLTLEQIAEYDGRVERWKSGEPPASGSAELDSKIGEVLAR